MGSACSACELAECEINLDVQVQDPDSSAARRLGEDLVEKEAMLLSGKEAKKARGAKSTKDRSGKEKAPKVPRSLGQHRSSGAAKAVTSAPAPPDVAMPSSEVTGPCSPDASPMGDAFRSEAPLFDHGCVAPQAPLFDHGCVAPEEDHLLDESFVAGPVDAAMDEPLQVEVVRLPTAPPRAWPQLPSVGTWLRPAPRPLRTPSPAPATAPPAPAAAAEGAKEEHAASAISQLAVEDEAFVCVLAWPVAEEAPKEPQPPTAERPFFLLPSVGSWLRPASRLQAPPAAVKAAPLAAASTSLLDAPLLLDSVSYGTPMPAEWKEDPAAAAAWFADQLTATTTTTLVGYPHVSVFGDGDLI